MVTPIELHGLGPMIAIEGGLDTHLGDSAVGRIIAGVVLELVEHHGLAVVEHHGLADGVCVGVEVRIVEAVVEGKRLLRIIAGVVLELVEHHGLAVVEHHGLADGVCVGVEVRIVEAVVEGKRLLEATVITALPAGFNRLGGVAPSIMAWP